MVVTAHLRPQPWSTFDPVRVIGIATAIVADLFLFAYLMLPASAPKDEPPCDCLGPVPPATCLVPPAVPIYLPLSGPAETSLVPIEAPAPIYPAALLRDGITGTVQLEMLVGTDGRVLEVRVLRSSGNRELDRVAQDEVLRHWRFQPVIRNGVAVQALGRVPMVFTLD